ncbi:type I restriction enzyme, S subunit [Geodermatophilus pulveris]|uniref:Type I restriction enzyme, S subunit n=1 Tax=Geodermatophilus pulveris TaxID=1564159 RepID=A0A239GLX7_9ACTN|nr:restriction endonuclease subunit S [Geodermatophilus pulveris]SNS69788.1 type I restriction enzyme, S subunit [Geodermatophilus pulveris]
MTQPQLRRLARVVNGGTPTSDASNWDGEVPWATPIDLGLSNGGTLTDTLRSLTQEGLTSGSALVPANSVLLSSRAPVGYVSVNDVPMAFNQGCKGLIPTSDLDNRYLMYVLLASKSALQAVATGTTFLEISSMNLGALRIPKPPLTEQVAVADFLDRETAQIDEMIQAQLELIAVLRSRRTAEVVAAVRLQQDTDNLPAGWELLPFKYAIASRFTGEWGGEPGSDDVDVSCVRVADFDRAHRRAGTAVPTTRSVSADKARAKALRPGDLLVERSGGTAKNPVGTVVLYNGPEGAISSNFIECVRLRDEHDPAFWCYLQEAAYSTGFTQVFVRQTSGIQNLDAQEFYREYFAAPGLAEQRRIAAALDQQTAQLAEMIDAANDVVSLLRERREALISAAVTGRIDPGTGIETVEETP